MSGRNIGGSILPSSAPHILQPMRLGALVIQVRAIPEADTHGLFIETPHGPSLLATHPNGYSCHNLGERMTKGDKTRVREQAEYILRCGGTVRDMDAICELVETTP